MVGRVCVRVAESPRSLERLRGLALKVWYERLCSAASRGYGERNSVERPMRAVTTVGIGGSGAGGGDWYWCFEQGKDDEIMSTENNGAVKPPYHVMSMEEIRALPPNGFNAISTFSGCGGSSLGYKMAGFNLLWASEFIPAAQDTYRANHPNTILDTRDIRIVKPQEILDAIRIERGQLDLFDGSPPCASFSTAGKRHKGWGQVKKYSDTEQRTDDLFFEYARLIDGIQPKVFVAENVSGLVKGVAKGYFIEILTALRALGYNVQVRLLDASWLGVPQVRWRTIFVGVRNDLVAQYGILPAHPKPMANRYSVRDAIPWIEKVVHDTSGSFSTGDVTDRACPTVTVGVNSLNSVHFKVHTRITGRTGPGFERVETELDKPMNSILVSDPDQTRYQIEHVIEADAHIEGYAIHEEWKKIQPGQSSEKFFNLVKPDLDKPCPSITQTAGNTGAAGVCHPLEPRKFSILELKRICGFPDDFILTGTYQQQWERLGRAVPPLMMKAIAETVRDQILRKLPQECFKPQAMIQPPTRSGVRIRIGGNKTSAPKETA